MVEFLENLWNLWLQIIFIELLCFRGFQNCPSYAFKHIWKPKNLSWMNEFWPNIGILTNSLKLTSYFGWPCRPHNWLKFRVSVRYKYRPCLGREWLIGQQHLWNLKPCKGLLQKDICLETGCMNICFNTVLETFIC